MLTFFIGYVYAVGEQKEKGGYTVTGVPALVPVGFWFLYLAVVEYIWGSLLVTL